MLEAVLREHEEVRGQARRDAEGRRASRLLSRRRAAAFRSRSGIRRGT
ncbi:MAG: hypothetical protein ACR2GU_04700 [Rubrobacteraceae bacterium]